MAKFSITKLEMAECIADSPAWGGDRNVDRLVRNHTWTELHDMFTEIEDAENDYYGAMYGY